MPFEFSGHREGMSNSGDESATDTDDTGYISDDQLPEDLRPSENPLARNPEDDDSDEDRDAGPGAAVEGMPDLGDPGSV
jgi:hypothetical protein